MNSGIGKTVMYFSKRCAVGLVGWEAERSNLSDITHNIWKEKFIVHSQWSVFQSISTSSQKRSQRYRNRVETTGHSIVFLKEKSCSINAVTMSVSTPTSKGKQEMAVLATEIKNNRSQT